MNADHDMGGLYCPTFLFYKKTVLCQQLILVKELVYERKEKPLQ